MYVDDVRVQGQVGYLLQDGMTQMHYYLNTHLHFDIAYNDMPEQGGIYQVLESCIVVASWCDGLTPTISAAGRRQHHY